MAIRFFNELIPLLTAAVPANCVCEQLDEDGKEFKFTHRKKTLVISVGRNAPRHSSAKGVLSKVGVRKTQDVYIGTGGRAVSVKVGRKKCKSFQTFELAAVELASYLQ